MQVIFLTLLLALLPGILSGESANLLQEWEKSVSGRGTSLLPQWRFGNWGVRQEPGKPLLRSCLVEAKGGKVSVTLENNFHDRSANLLIRPFPLSDTERKRYRFSITGVNQAPDKALLRIRLSASGSVYTSREKIFSVSSQEETFSAALDLPRNSKMLSIQICLSGRGKVVLTKAHLSSEELLPISKPTACVLPGETFLIPERTPVLFPVKVPTREVVPADSFVSVTLPWGIRLINSSYPAVGESLKLSPGKNTVTRLKLPAKRNIPDGYLYLLLGSDLAPSPAVHTASLVYESPNGRREEHFFRLQVVKGRSVLPPRNFRIMLNGSERVAPLECKEDADNALLRSGANILNASTLPIPDRILRNARIKQYCELPLPPVPAKQHCFYASIRDESFWEKYVVSTLRRRILRQQGSSAQGLLCDSYLGQRRGIECLCALCRAELADFAPKLPPQAVINYSKALLNSRFSKELRSFRNARQKALHEGARYHLPTGKTAFARPPQLIFCYTSEQILSLSAPLVSSSETVVDFNRGALLPDGISYNAAANTEVYKAVRKKMQLFLPKGKITAKLSPSPKHITPERVPFEMLNILFSGYSGVWISLSPGANWSFNAAVAETAELIREYENFFRSNKKIQPPLTIARGNFTLEVPPIPSWGFYREACPAQMEGLQLRAWQYGKENLIGIGNFSDAPRTCTLANKTVAPDRYVMIDRQKISGKELAEKGFDLTIPPYSWKFLKFTLL